MAHPYRESYVDEVAETQGALFDRLQDESPDADGADLIRCYMKRVSFLQMSMSRRCAASMSRRSTCNLHFSHGSNGVYHRRRKVIYYAMSFCNQNETE